MTLPQYFSSYYHNYTVFNRPPPQISSKLTKISTDAFPDSYWSTFETHKDCRTFAYQLDRTHPIRFNENKRVHSFWAASEPFRPNKFRGKYD